jgi:hypothetical protein
MVIYGAQSHVEDCAADVQKWLHAMVKTKIEEKKEENDRLWLDWTKVQSEERLETGFSRG